MLAACEPAPVITIAAAGDIACAPEDPVTPDRCHQQATSDLLLGIDPEAVLAIGDLQYNSGSLSDFNASYHPSWGRLRDRTNPVVGNHEYGTSGARGYFDYFGDRATPRQPGCRSNCGGYYSYDVGNWHIVALNSNCSRPNASCAAGSDQEKWLRADLAASSKECTLAYMHHPLFSSSSGEPLTRPLVQALYDHGTELLLAGHVHYYERFAPQDPNGVRDDDQGIRQLTVGTGGAFFTGSSTRIANSEVKQRNRFGVLQLDLGADTYEWNFVADPSTPFTDTGSGTCH